MATVNKDFKIKHGLVVEGTSGTIDGNDILTKKQEDIDYIIGEVGGSGVSTNTPNTLVLRDSNGDFAAGTVTAETKLVAPTVEVGSMGTVSDNGDELAITAAEGEDIRLTADDVRVDAADDFRVNVGGDILLSTSGVETGVYVGSIDTGNQVVTELTLDNHIGDNTVDGTSGNTVTDRIATAKQEAIDAAGGDITAHTSATSGVHGVTGDVVGTTDTQTLTNKTLGSGTNLSVNLDMNGNKIEDLGTPTAGTDAATKNYVDSGDADTLAAAESYADEYYTALSADIISAVTSSATSITTNYQAADATVLSSAEAYADQAELDAIATANAYTDQAELDAIDAAATAAAALYAPLSGVTFTGEVILHADPSQALGAATKQYVDSMAEGLHVKAAVLAATTGNLSGTYSNGTNGEGATLNLGSAATLDIDGVTSWSQYDGILVKDQTNAFENGRYFVDQVGGASTDWILKRCTSCDEASEIPSSYVFVQSGNTYEATGWVAIVEDPSAFDVGVDDINWTQFSGAGSYLAGTGLSLSGETFSIDETYTATKSYVDGEISDLDTSLQAYADQAEVDAKAYTDTRESAITTAYQAYADQAEADANTYADGVASTAETNARAYTDTREIAITSAYEAYADSAEADANLYTDQEISALDTDDIEEGASNLYYTDDRVKDVLTNSSQTNISITNVAGVLTITAENGVAGSTTDDLAEGSNNLYFTDARAQAAVAGDIATAIDALTTDDIEEGTTNKYFSDALAQAAVATDISTAVANGVAAGDDTATPVYLAINVADVAKQIAATVEAETAGVVTAYSWAKSDYRSAEFLVKTVNGTHTEISKVLLTLDTSDNIAITEYAMIGTNGELATVSAAISGANVEIQVTTNNANSTVIVVGTLLV